MTTRRIIGGSAGLALGIGAALGLCGLYGFGETTRDDVHRASEGMMPSLDGATGWVNSVPLTPAALRGKVVVFEFWTLSCINWRRQLPYVRAWAERYRDRGLVVIGVYAPEFAFERDPALVKLAADTMQITFPIAIDSDHAIWDAFDNHYWPALYFVDARGRIRYHEFGEGEYDASERVIQRLLAEAGDRTHDRGLVAVNGNGFETAADWFDLASSEIYLGSARAQARHDEWSLEGAWTIGHESAVGDAGARIVVRFHARDLHLVMRPARAGTRVHVRVRIDGSPPGSAHGLDLDAEGNGIVGEPRLYQLIRQPAPIRDRTFELEVLDPGLEIFSVTFG